MLKALIIAITVLTWNTARMDYKHKPADNEVLQYLLSQDADVVCLQEVDVYKDDKYLTLPDVRQTLKTKYPYSNRCDIVMGHDTIRLINNHLESYKLASEDLTDMDRIEAKWKRAIPLRNAQAQVVRREIEASPYPVVVVGDFNSVALSFAYWHISRGLHDAWNETHYFWEWGATYEYNGIGLRIDYILCSDPLKPTTCSVPNISVSDHKPVVATLVW